MESTELARLRRVAGKQTTRLTHYGRKTGKPYDVTICFLLDSDKLYIGTANVNRQWVRDVHKTPKVSGTVIEVLRLVSTFGRRIAEFEHFDSQTALQIKEKARL